MFGASLNYKHLLSVTPSLPTLTTQREAPHPCPSLPERRNGAAKRVDRRQLPYFKWGIKHIYIRLYHSSHGEHNDRAV